MKQVALLKNLSRSLLVNEQIETTLPKAKDLRPFVEKILTMGKSNTLHSKRKVLSYLGDLSLVNKVFDVLAKRYAKRNGGYVRILKSGFRYGDSAPKAIIELVERDISAKGFVDKKRVEEQKKHSEQKTPEDKVVNEETQIESKEKKQKQADDKSQETKPSSSSKKQKKDSKE